MQGKAMPQPGALVEVQAAPEQLRERRYQLLLLGLLLLGWTLRLLFWWQQGRSGVVQPAGDSEEYYRGAIHILKELGYYDTSQWIRAPLPSLFLALSFLLLGLSLPLVLGFQALVSGLLVLPVAATARSYYASRRAGLLAGLLAALYLPFVQTASELMSEPLGLLAIALTLWCLERWRGAGRLGWLFWAGLSFGCFILARPVGLYAQVLVLLWIWWRMPGWPARLRAAAVFLLGVWLLLGPWALRNTLRFGQLVLVDTNAGFSFWSGTPEPNDRLEMQLHWNRSIANPAKRQSAQFARAFENIQREPGAWLGAMRHKAVTFWQLRLRVLIANAFPTLTPPRLVTLAALVGDLLYILLALAALASVLYARPAAAHWFMLLWPVYGTLMASMSLGHPRLRLPFEVVLPILGAYALAHPHELWRRLRASRLRRRAALLGAGLGVLLLIYSSTYLAFARSQGHALAAFVWWSVGNYQRAIVESQAALRSQPGSALPLLTLAQRQAALGDQQAKQTWEAALRLDRHILVAHAQLLRLALEAEDQAQIAARLQAIAALGRDDNALYRWLWEHVQRRPRADLAIGSPADLALVRGVSGPAQEQGLSFRWTHQQALLRMPGGPPTTLNLQLRGWRPTTVVQIAVDGTPVGSCPVGTQWQVCSIAVPEQAGERIITVAAPLDVPWPPQDYLPRGVALARAWLEP